MAEISLSNEQNYLSEQLALSQELQQKAQAWVDSGIFFWKGTTYGCPVITPNLPRNETDMQDAISVLRSKGRYLQIGYMNKSHSLEKPGCLRIWESSRWVEKPGYYIVSEIIETPEQIACRSLRVYIDSDKPPESEESICTIHKIDPKSFNPVVKKATLSDIKRFNNLLPDFNTN